MSLDFVNTLRDRATTPRETLVSASALNTWMAEVGLTAPGPKSLGTSEAPPGDLYVQALELREAIDAVLSPERAPQPSHARLVNRWSLLPPRAQLQESDPGTVAARVLTLTEALGAIAAETIAIIVRGEQGQIKVCAHQRCGLRFLDRSRTKQRQWCSMQRCGNRAKVARHTARHHE